MQGEGGLAEGVFGVNGVRGELRRVGVGYTFGLRKERPSVKRWLGTGTRVGVSFCVSLFNFSS